MVWKRVVRDFISEHSLGWEVTEIERFVFENSVVVCDWCGCVG